MAARQRPKRSRRSAQNRRIEGRQDARQENRIDQRIADRIARRSGTSAASTPVVATPGYPVPIATSQYPQPVPGTYPPSAGPGGATPGSPGTTELSMPIQSPGDYSWAPENERHAVTTNQEPADSWPPVDLPPLTGFTTGETPIDNGQANPETIYGGAADVETSPYYDYNDNEGAY